MTRSPSVPGSRLGAIAACLILALALASCGSSGSSSSSGSTTGSETTAESESTTGGETASASSEPLTNPKLPPPPSNVEGAEVRAAQEFLLERYGAPKFTPPGPTFDISEVEKPAWFIAQTPTLPVTPYINKGFEEAGKAAGVETHICAGEGATDKNAICLQQAVAAGAGSVEIFSVDPNTIAKPLADARKAGVKVVSGNNALMIGEPNPSNVDAQVSHNYFDAGQLSGAYAVATWGADTDSLCLSIPEFIVTKVVCEGFEEAVAEYCPDCNVETKEIPVAQLADQSAAVVNQAVLQNSGLNYIEGSIDDFCGIIAPTLKRLGKSPEEVACAGQNGNVPSLEEIKNDGYQRMTAGQDTQWWGWAFFDAAARVQVQPMPKAVITTPNELITRESLAKYNGPIDYDHTAEIFGVPEKYWQGEFEKSWGLG